MNYKTIIILINFIILIAATALMSKTSNLTPMEQLGKKLFFDKIADPDNMSCASCHSPKVGFTGPIPGINKHGAVYRGAVRKRFGNRKPPSAAYATLSPIFHFDTTDSLFIGGNFWDGRATGERLGNPAAEQALGPFLNPVEHNNNSKLAVLKQVKKAKYSWMWEVVWGEPISYFSLALIEQNYDRIGLAIAAYEASSEVNQFSSKYDYYLQGFVDLTLQEANGLLLFNDPLKGNCAACHPSEVSPTGDPPLFTDFSFDNLGTPKNLKNPFYNMNNVFLPDGDPINPLGMAWIDFGLGGFLANHPDPDWRSMAPENMGKHKVPTLRNVDKRPGKGFPKAYLHNGVFKSLKEVVHFYNTRDVQIWPAPEVPENVNTDELGNLGLTENEEDDIVAFMKTLSDGYKLTKIKEFSNIENHFASLKIVGPNPFNPTTRFSFYLPESDNIQLDVYNLVGQKVATLIKGEQSSGEHQIDFNAADLPSGLYLIRLLTSTNIVTNKIVLLK